MNHGKKAYQLLLSQRYRLVFGYAGLILILVGAILLAPVLAFLAYPGEGRLWPYFVLPAGLLILPGLLAWKRMLPAPALSLTEGAAVVVLAWGGAILIGSMPFLLIDGLGPTRAIFEATSGWTTTGLSVLEVDKAPAALLLYRSILQLAGGAGLAILMVSLISIPAAPGLSMAEGRREQLVPHVVRSAKLVVRIYAAYILLGIVGLGLAGMGWFDAVLHTFAAVSTGGFSSKAGSIGAWNDPAVEAVIMVLEVLGMTSFLTAYRVARGHWQAAYRSPELRLFFFLVPTAASALLMFTAATLYPSMAEATRICLFETVSALSTTGFTVTTYRHWNDSGLLVLTLLMMIGGGVGSTAGGIKQMRIILLYRLLSWEVRKYFMPARIDRPAIRQGDEVYTLREAEIVDLSVFHFLYFFTLAAGTFVIVAHGVPLAAALFEMASAVSTVGLSVGLTGPETPPVILWTQIAGMILGRLEFLTIIIGLARIAEDIKGWLSP